MEREHLRDELARTQVELDRALATIRQLEGNMQSQVAIGHPLLYQESLSILLDHLRLSPRAEAANS